MLHINEVKNIESYLMTKRSFEDASKDSIFMHVLTILYHKRIAIIHQEPRT